jgi:23S rRNA (pseudouridine1915-N3)-methyltransferase
MEACREYLKRLAPYAKVSVEEISDRGNWDANDARQALHHEGALIIARLRTDELTVVLDRCGKQFTSEEIAGLIHRQQLVGAAKIRFVIGGSHGIAPAIVQRADLTLSLGALTLPHNLARVVMLEQLYRAFRIIADEPYHK